MCKYDSQYVLYLFQRENKSSTMWRCTSRSKNVKCPVLVKQVGDRFDVRNEHLHAPVADRKMKVKVSSKVIYKVIQLGELWPQLTFVAFAEQDYAMNIFFG